jgi:tetratricopeptide (TPR) repeat protein
VFISYVREDTLEVERMQRLLEAAGVPVWRDTRSLWPGEDWRVKIRQAITANALAFVACFSHNSERKARSYQREELALAIDQFRIRNPEQPWLIPVRFADCLLPYYDLGSGRTLDSLQRADLIGELWEPGSARLVEGVLRVIRPSDVYLSCVADDRGWARWLARLLDEAGLRVVTRPPEALVEAPDMTGTRQRIRAARHVVVVLSEAYVRSAECRATLDELGALGLAGDARPVVPVYVGGSGVGNPFPSQETVNLDRLDERTARRAVLRLLQVEMSDVPGEDGRRWTGPRFPGAYPPVWNVPARNPTFTGRTTLLDRLRADLNGLLRETRPQVLHGLGGVGKTQIALEYAHRFHGDYDIVWWIPSEEPNRAQQSLADLADRVGIHTSDVVEATAAVREYLQRSAARQKALLIFDNVQTSGAETLRAVIPADGTAHVVITSRDSELSTIATSTLDVDVFTRAESVEHLRLMVPDLAEEDADRLADLLGDLPIVVKMAAAWLTETGQPVTAYLDRLCQDPDVVLGEAPPEHLQPVTAAWRATIDQLRERSPAAVRLLELCAFFGPEPIAMRLIHSDAFIDALRHFDPYLGDEKLMVDRLVRDLGRFALARVDFTDQSIQIHRLLQALVRGSLSPDDQAQMRGTIRRVLARLRPAEGDVDNPSTWPAYAILWPHLYACGADQTDEAETRQLMVDRVRYLATRGQINAALDLGRRMQAIWQAQTPDDTWTLALGCEVANALRQLGQAEESLEIDLDVHERQRSNPRLGPAHLHTLRTAGSLAADLRALGRWSEALDRDRKTHELMAREYGPDQPRTLWAANNLAVSLRITGRCFEARDLDQTIYDQRREMLGVGHALTLLSATSLGRDLSDCGQFTEALRLLHTTLDLCRDELGESTPTTLYATKELGSAARRAGRYDEARQRTRAVYDELVTVFGRDAPETLSCALSLARDESDSGNVEIARKIASRAWEAYAVRLGGPHPYTLASASNVSAYLAVAGDLSAAAALAEATHQQLSRGLGAGHLFTLSCGVNLANISAEMGHGERALELLTRAAEAFARTLGRAHPESLASAANRAILLSSAGRDREANQLRSQTLEMMRGTYGGDHHDTAALQAWRLIYRELEPHQT